MKGGSLFGASLVTGLSSVMVVDLHMAGANIHDHSLKLDTCSPLPPHAGTDTQLLTVVLVPLLGTVAILVCHGTNYG